MCYAQVNHPPKKKLTEPTDSDVRHKRVFNIPTRIGPHLQQWVREGQSQAQEGGGLLKGKCHNPGSLCPVILGLRKEGIG